MQKIINMIGKRFGKLIVIKRAEHKPYQKPKFICKCDCGKQIVPFGYDLRKGHTTSCGCSRKEGIKKHGHVINGKMSATYRTWSQMIVRCNNPKSISYKYYGGRGIQVCDRWLNSFENFLADMGERPKNKTIDRKNNDGNYTPENCRWATSLEQANNTRNNHYITINGKTHSLAHWCRYFNINYGTAKSRIHRSNWSPIKALTFPVRKIKSSI